jgi:hypothetical protein
MKPRKRGVVSCVAACALALGASITGTAVPANAIYAGCNVVKVQSGVSIVGAKLWTSKTYCYSIAGDTKVRGYHHYGVGAVIRSAWFTSVGAYVYGPIGTPEYYSDGYDTAQR